MESWRTWQESERGKEMGVRLIGEEDLESRLVTAKGRRREK